MACQVKYRCVIVVRGYILSVFVPVQAFGKMMHYSRYWYSPRKLQHALIGDYCQVMHYSVLMACAVRICGFHSSNLRYL